MKRRELLAGVLAAAALRAASAAAADKTYRIALVNPSTPVAEMTETGSHPGYVPFFQELRRLGYVEGQNLIVLRFSGGGDIAHLDALVLDVVGAGPDVIVANSSRLVLSLKAATRTIPVIGNMADPITFGIVGSLARPGGNITGVTTDAGMEIWGKRIALLREAVPAASRIGFLAPETVWNGTAGTAMREAARQASVAVASASLKGLLLPPEYRRVFEAMQRDQVQAVVVNDSPDNLEQRQVIVALAAETRLPAIYPYRDYVPIGGLMAYADDLPDRWRRCAGYVDLIFKGTKPGEIPIYQATKFNFIVDLKTAKALGLDLAPTLIARADEIIE